MINLYRSCQAGIIGILENLFVGISIDLYAELKYWYVFILKKWSYVDASIVCTFPFFNLLI